MGSNNSKTEVSGVFSTPKKTPEDLIITVNPEEMSYNLDPRSPNVCRTPIDNILHSGNGSNPTLEMMRITSPEFQNPTTIWKNKLLKELKINLNDPRSPSQFLNRTPIVFDDSSDKSVLEESFNMNDKFADLFIDVAKEESPIVNQVSKEDPRSPCEEITRSPIVFTDDVPIEIEAPNAEMEITDPKTRIYNKPLERIKNKTRTRCSRVEKKKSVYEDRDQVFSPQKQTPRKPRARTPLSCVGNQTHIRSRSVENTLVPKKSRIPATSFDDHNLSNSENIEMVPRVLF